MRRAMNAASLHGMTPKRSGAAWILGRSTVQCFSLLTLTATLLAVSSPAVSPTLPDGVINTQDPKDKPLSPAEALKKITVPDGFQVTLFAGEPDLMQPVA